MSATVGAARTAGVSPWWLALLAGPLSFGITGAALVLGDVARDLGVTLVDATALVTAFGWGIAVATPLMGVLLARRGVQVALTTAAVLVAVGAALVLLVPALPALIVGSALQALGSAGMAVVALSLAGTPAAMGIVTSSLASIGAVAPLIGTFIATSVSWQAALVMPLMSLLAVPAVVRGSVERERSTGDRVDAIGAVPLVALVTALVVVPRQPLIGAASALAVALVLVGHVRRRPAGFVPAAVVTARRFAGSAALGLGLAVVNFGIIYAVPALLTPLTGWTSSQLGIAMLVPYLIGGALSWFLVTGLARLRYAALVAVLGAGAIAALTLAVLGTTVLAMVFAAMVLGSLTAATGQGALALHVRRAVPEREQPTTLGLFTLCYLLGAAFGPAIAALAVS